MENTIRNYRNTVQIEFNERGDNFSLDVPHYNKWLAIIKFLRKRGWKIGENKYYKKQYKTLSKSHKIGKKGDMALLMEIQSSGIKIEFGNIKNLWSPMAQSFWDDPTDDRYTHLTYLEETAVKLEIKKLMQFFEQYEHRVIINKDSLTPEEFIIDKLKSNRHIHGEVNCLEDIKTSIDKNSYDYLHNSNDQNGKKIICGDRKCFYDSRTRRLFIGTAWHNINNMWWIIINNNFTNIASFELFDFDSKLPRRKPASKREQESILKRYEKKRDYIRCHQILKSFHHQINR